MKIEGRITLTQAQMYKLMGLFQKAIELSGNEAVIVLGQPVQSDDGEATDVIFGIVEGERSTQLQALLSPQYAGETFDTYANYGILELDAVDGP